MSSAPGPTIGRAVVLEFSPLDQRHRATGNTRHFVGGELLGSVAGLVICQYDEEKSVYLFRCDAEWRWLTDTFHESVDEAKEQAEFEYEGVSQTWQHPG